jgi:hypothetical protein
METDDSIPLWRRAILVLLAPIVLPIGLVVMLPLGMLALLSIPYFACSPDRHRHFYDFAGTPRQRELLRRWREKYDRLGILGRIARAQLRRQRRKRVGYRRTSALIRRMRNENNP